MILHLPRLSIPQSIDNLIVPLSPANGKPSNEDHSCRGDSVCNPTNDEVRGIDLDLSRYDLAGSRAIQGRGTFHFDITGQRDGSLREERAQWHDVAVGHR